MMPTSEPTARPESEITTKGSVTVTVSVTESPALAIKSAGMLMLPSAST